MVTLGSLPVGAVVKSLGTTYNGAVIRWVVGHQDSASGRTKLIAEKVITLKCSDAKEPSNPNYSRTQYGNNRYSVSNIDQWLNSTAGAGAWYSKRHDYDAPPTNANVWLNYNEYDAEAGFLSNFEEAFRNAILDTTIRVVKSSVDGGGYEDITRKVYLLSNTEVGLSNESGVAEGSKWDLFSDDNSRKAYPTAEAVSRSEYTNSSLNASSPWYWRLRTPYAGDSSYAWYVNTGGTLSSNVRAYSGNRGVRPALELDSGILVSDTPDTDGAYIIQWWTPPSIYPRIGGVSRAYSDGSVKIGGVWRTIDEVHTRIGGVWRKS
jgi:hypothetical protein